MENQIFLKKFNLRPVNKQLVIIYVFVTFFHAYLLFVSTKKYSQTIHYSLKNSQLTSVKVKLSKAQDFKKVQKEKIVKSVKPLKQSRAVKRTDAVQRVESANKQILSEFQAVKEDKGVNSERARYLSYLRSLINDKKTYPKLAKRLRHEGKLKVELLIDGAGKILSIKYLQKSNSKLLDNATADFLRSVKSFGELPRSIKERPLRAVVPISYDLI